MRPRNDDAADSGQSRGARAQQSNQHAHGTSRAAQQQCLLAALRLAPLTTFEGRAMLGVPHVAGRIQDLREAGFEILTTWTTARGTTGNLHRIAKYTLLGEPHQQEMLL